MTEKLKYTISDISELLNIEAHKIRYWEKKTGLIKPKRNANNRRVFSKQDLEVIKRLNHLIQEEKHSIEEAALILNQNFNQLSKAMSMLTKIQTVLGDSE